MVLEDAGTLSFFFLNGFSDLSVVFYDVVLFVNGLVEVIGFCLFWVLGEVRGFDVFVGT